MDSRIKSKGEKSMPN